MSVTSRDTSIAALAYVAGPLSGLCVLALAKHNTFACFHAVQSMIFFGATSVLMISFMFFPLYGWIIGLLLGFGGSILWFVLIWKALQGERFVLPFIGTLASKQLANILTS